MQLGLEQQISDDEQEEEEVNESKFVYETEEDEIIDEYDVEYLEHIAQVEAEKADPGVEILEGEDGYEEYINKKGRVSGSNHYDQLKQEDEIIGRGNIASALKAVAPQ